VLGALATEIVAEGRELLRQPLFPRVQCRLHTPAWPVGSRGPGRAGVRSSRRLAGRPKTSGAELLHGLRRLQGVWQCSPRVSWTGHRVLAILLC